ncbi:beta strand repeat-containing protein, partial [Marinimicrobium agarilyticum]|uniref:beta strand repeat-containing protein n=1 Tax=Marinimicrobium agarilyticum TaxID=306546 RepID=UPI000568B392
WTLTGAGSGIVEQDVEGDPAYAYAFENMQALVGGTSNDKFVVNVGASVESIRGFSESDTETESVNILQVKSASGSTVEWSVASDNSGKVVDVVGDQTPYRVNTFYDIDHLEGGEGADTFTVTDYSENANIFVNGGATGDRNTFSFSGVDSAVNLSIGGGSEPWRISNIQTVVGSDHQDSTLKIASGTNTWTLNDQNSGFLEQTGVDDNLFSGELFFSNFANITGGTGDDSFIFTSGGTEGTSGSLTGTLDGGEGGFDRLTGLNIDNLWALGLDGSDPSLNQLMDNTGSSPIAYLTRFMNIDKLVGGSSSDIFRFGDDAALVGVDGGSAQGNRLDFSQRTQNVTVTIGSTGLDNVNNIQAFTGNSEDGYIATLAIVDGNNEWDIAQHSAESTLNSDVYGELGFSWFNVVQGGSGTDDFTVVSGEYFDGTLKGGLGNDSLTLVSGGAPNIWRLSPTDDNPMISRDGELRLKTFESVETLKGAGADTFYGRDVATSWTWSENTDDQSLEWTLSEDDGDIQGLTLKGMGKLIGGSAADTFTLESGLAFAGIVDGGDAGSNTLTVKGGTNSWALMVEEGKLSQVAGSVTDRLNRFSRFQTLAGDGGTHSLTGRNRATDWTWSENADDQSLEWTLDENEGIKALTLKGMDQLTGGTAADTFTLESGSAFEGTIDGGEAGANTLTVEGGANDWVLAVEENNLSLVTGSVTNRVNNFSRFQTLKGDGGTHSFTGRDRATDWTLSENATDQSDEWSLDEGAESIQALTLKGMNKLVGGSAADTFTLGTGTGFEGTLDGGTGGADTLTINGGPNTWQLDSKGTDAIVSMTGLVRVKTFQNLETLNGSTDDTFHGRDSETSWTLTTGTSMADNEWSLNNDELTLTGMKHLVGGSAADTFTLNANTDFKGTIDGGDTASNTLILVGGNNNWTLGVDEGNAAWVTGSVTNRVDTFSRFQTLQGSGTDSFTGRNRATDWTLSENATDQSDEWSLDEGTEGIQSLTLKGMNKLVGGSAADTFTLGISTGFEGTLDGGTDGADTLTINGGPNTWRLDHTGTDAIVSMTGLVRVKTFQNLNTLAGSGSDTFYGRDGQTTWTLTSGTTLATNEWTLSDDSDTLTLTGMNKLVGGTARDAFTLNADTDFDGIVDGGSGGGDTLAVLGGGNAWRVTAYGTNTTDGASGEVTSLSTTFSAINELLGATGDRLTGSNLSNTWTLTGADAGTLAATDDVGAEVTFSGMAALVGGGAADAFSTEGAVLFAGVIDGGAGGEDSLNVSSITDRAVTVGMLEPEHNADTWEARNDDDVTIRNIETLQADGGANEDSQAPGNRLFGPADGNYRWTLTGTNDGNVRPSQNGGNQNTLNFFEFEYLEAGAGTNTFAFTNNGELTGGIAGGGGETWIDYSLRTGALCVNLLGSSAACGGPVLSGIDGVIGNSSAGFNSQLLANGSDGYTWIIDDNGESRADGINDGLFQHGNETIAFIDFNQLLGGSGQDEFRFRGQGRLSGYLDGRSNTDTVNTVQSTQDMAFRLQESAPDGANGAGVWLKGIETITASSNSNNQLIGGNVSNEWVVYGDNRGQLNDNAITFSGISELWGGSSDDTFTIEESGRLSVGILGGGGDGRDSVLIKSGNNDTTLWSVTGAGMGTSDRVSTFGELEVLNGGQGNDQFTLTGVDAWIERINASAGDNRLTYEADKTDPVSATWTLSSARNGSVRLGDSDNTIGFNAIGRIDGAGSDRLIGSDAENDWRLTGANGGTLETTISSGSQSLVFNGMSTLEGNAGIDRFYMDGVDFNGLLLGGNGDDSLSASGANTWTLIATGEGNLNNVTDFESIQTLNGGGENNKLIAPERANTWRLTGERSGTLDDAGVADQRVTFTGMDTLVGHNQQDSVTAADDFTRRDLQSFAALDGGAGATDELDLSGLDRAITISVGNVEPAQNIEVDVVTEGFETLTAEADHDNHLVGGGSRTYEWTLIGQNRGDVTYTNGDSQQTTTFSGFSDLTGGMGGDIFAILDDGGATGDIDGGDGTNLIDYSLKTEAVTVTFGGLDGNISNISGVIGNNNGSGEFTSRLRLGETDSDAAWRLGSIAGVNQNCEEGCQNDGVNDGEVTLNGESLYFIDFNLLESGSGNDEFRVADDGRFIGSLIGGSGSDTLDISAAGIAQTIGLGDSTLADTNLTGVGTLIGSNDRQHRLYANNDPNTWRISENGGGSLNGDFLTFTGIQQLQGGSGVDDFILTGEGKAHTLHGGVEGERNTLDISGASEALWLSLDTDSADADVRLVGMDEVIGNNGFNHRLEGDRRTNRWSIDRRNGGTLNDVLRFSDVKSLQGNRANDVFTFGAGGRVEGVIHGGSGGENRVDLSALPDTEQWTIATTEEAQTDLNLIEIQTLDGRRDAEHTLLGTNANTDWTVTNLNSGTLGELTFTGVANLLGGT